MADKWMGPTLKKQRGPSYTLPKTGNERVLCACGTRAKQSKTGRYQLRPHKVKRLGGMCKMRRVA